MQLKQKGLTNHQQSEIDFVDPSHGLSSMLFDHCLRLKFFEPELDLFAEFQHNNPSIMHSNASQRQSCALLLWRNPKHFT